MDSQHVEMFGIDLYTKDTSRAVELDLILQQQEPPMNQVVRPSGDERGQKES